MSTVPSDLLGEAALGMLAGEALAVVDAAAPAERRPAAPVCVAVDRAGSLPSLDPGDFDGMVTIRPGAPAPWVSVAPARLAAQVHRVTRIAAQAPVAAAMLARLLRIGETLAFETALEVESLAYSTLLGGSEFARWRAASGRKAPTGQGWPPVRYERVDDTVTLVLASPANRNAMTAAMRDGLYEALANVLEDPTEPGLVLRGEGACFSTGGDLAEFGSAGDLARAHLVRTARSGARLLHRLGPRAEAQVHGACIGSGIEIPAAAARRIAAPDTFVQLPELAMGLIPGAGGTVSLARAIGRHRLLWMALGGFRVGAAQALGWGLFHAIAP